MCKNDQKCTFLPTVSSEKHFLSRMTCVRKCYTRVQRPKTVQIVRTNVLWCSKLSEL